MIRSALIAALMIGAAMPALADTQIILAGNLVPDAETGAIGPSTITVIDGRITAITKGLTKPDLLADMTVINLSTKTVVPGLIDLHVHLTGDPGGDFWKRTTEPAEWGVVVGAKMRW